MGVFEMNHPLIQHKLSYLRNKDTDTKIFRETLNEIAGLMTYEATKGLRLKEIETETPIMKTTTKVLADPVSIVPILRAGLGMVEGMVTFLPTARVGHIGVYRDEETLEPVYYYCKLPVDIAKSKVFLVDPMLATGGSANYAIDYLKQKGVKDISFLCIIAAPEGIERVQEAHPDVDIYAASIDEGLNEKSYIYPGLGDAGDRIFGTK
ncbi:MAG: uracil phosphoribosyltransferase [Fusobacteriales bacterium]|jgi:uracil phosphoribosyltransferase|nr:uracil phosphoribosyltransferase [Fusobacteriales bacterium]